ncbi:hypothetical protein [Antrihabitans spumae]|uniref:Uncharacterized protein n=1 Tax=Antrihabitans spumae TaxID=3373370 RepID=A0ABW7KGS0_9NOCA
MTTNERTGMPSMSHLLPTPAFGVDALCRHLQSARDCGADVRTLGATVEIGAGRFGVRR